MKNNQTKTSLAMFNFIKGFTMIMLIFVHTYGLFPDSLNFSNCDFFGLSLVTTFFSMIFIDYLMPALMVVSGYGYRKNASVKKCVLKQVETLIKPYALTALLTCILHFVTHFSLYNYLPGALKETGKLACGFIFGFSETKKVLGITIFSCGPNWFLLALFWGLIIFNFLLVYFDGIKLLIATFGVACIGWILGLTSLIIPWCISQGCVTCFYICLGYLAKKNRIFVTGIEIKYKVLLLIFVIIPSAFPAVRGGYNGMANNIFPLGPFTILENGLLSVILVYLSLYINVFSGKILSSIRSLGRYSLYFLCVHTAEMMGVPLYYLAERWPWNQNIGLLLFAVIRLIVDIVICYLVIRIKSLLAARIKY